LIDFLWSTAVELHSVVGLRLVEGFGKGLEVERQLTLSSVRHPVYVRTGSLGLKYLAVDFVLESLQTDGVTLKSTQSNTQLYTE